MSGEAQRQRNMELGIRDIKAKIGEELKTFHIILHDFNNEEPQEPKIFIKDGVRFVTHFKLLTDEEIAEYEGIKKNDG